MKTELFNYTDDTAKFHKLLKESSNLSTILQQREPRTSVTPQALQRRVPKALQNQTEQTTSNDKYLKPAYKESYIPIPANTPWEDILNAGLVDKDAKLVDTRKDKDTGYAIYDYKTKKGVKSVFTGVEDFIPKEKKKDWTFSERVTGALARPFEEVGELISERVSKLPGGKNKYVQMAATLPTNLAAGIVNPPRMSTDDLAQMPGWMEALTAIGMQPEVFFALDAAQAIKAVNAVGLPTRAGIKITAEEFNAAKANYWQGAAGSKVGQRVGTAIETAKLQPEAGFAKLGGEGAGNVWYANISEGGKTSWQKLENPKKIDIEGFEDYDFVVSRPVTGDKNKWLVTEGRSGLTVSEGATRAEAIDIAKIQLDTTGKQEIDELLKLKAEKGEISPRYTTTKPVTPEVAPSQAVKEPWKLGNEDLWKIKKLADEGKIEPWQTTKSQNVEYMKAQGLSQEAVNRAIQKHKLSIEQAISEGKPVPQEVLKDYPELAKKYFEKSFFKTYGNKPETIQSETALARRQRELANQKPAPVLTKDEARRFARMSQSELDKYNASILAKQDAGKVKPTVPEATLSQVPETAAKVETGGTVPPSKPPVAVAEAAAKEPKNILNDYLQHPDRLKEAVRQKKLTSLQRAVRINERFTPALEKALADGLSPEEALKQATQTLSGEMSRFKTTLGDLIPEDMRQSLYQKIIDKWGVNDYRTVSATRALDNALAGKPIPNLPGIKGGSALKLLRETFDDTPDVMKMIEKPDAWELDLYASPRGVEEWINYPKNSVAKQLAMLPPSGREVAKEALKKAGVSLLDVLNLPRSFITAFDLSASGRQGLIMSLSHPFKAAKSFRNQIRSLLSEKAAIALDKEILARSHTAQSIARGKLFFSDVAGPLTQREEAIASRFTAKVWGAKQSQRAFSTFLNDLSSRVYEEGAELITKAGGNVGDLDSLAEYVNWARGRGSLPKSFQGAANILNATFFSPRLVLSRLQLPAKLASSNPYVRKEAWKAATALLGFGSSIIGLTYLATGRKPEVDPRSSEFAKVRFGSTRLDFWAGYVQYARFAAQLSSGEKKSTAGEVKDQNRFETLLRFAQSKSSPASGLVIDLLKGQSYSGEELQPSAKSIGKQAYNRLTPLAVQDMIDAMITEGIITGTGLGGLSSLGFGVVTYGNEQSSTQKRTPQIIKGSQSNQQRRIPKTLQQIGVK